MKPKVYIETSVISYLAALPSRDLVVAAHQQTTHEWWQTWRHDFDLYVSQLVKAEASRGDPEAAQKRLNILQKIEFLRTGTDAEVMARSFLNQKVLPKKAADDALHIAIATVNGMEYLLT
ncbi:MAG: type II toxin-antitoxin system VapC family toxin [bacterium]